MLSCLPQTRALLPSCRSGHNLTGAVGGLLASLQEQDEPNPCGMWVWTGWVDGLGCSQPVSPAPHPPPPNPAGVLRMDVQPKLLP